MLVLGGFPSVGDLSMPSRQLWLYNGLNGSWTQLDQAVSVE